MNKDRSPGGGIVALEHTVITSAPRRTGAGALVAPRGNTVNLVTLTFATGVALAGVARAEDPQALLRKYDCTLCHAIDEAKTGPAFVEVAAKYRGDPKAVATLADVIRKGTHGSGPWPMPPSPQASAADARTIARYILALPK